MRLFKHYKKRPLPSNTLQVTPPRHYFEENAGDDADDKIGHLRRNTTQVQNRDCLRMIQPIGPLDSYLRDLKQEYSNI